MVKTATFAALLMLGGCSATGGEAFCTLGYHTYSDATIEAMTEEEAKQEVAYNQLIAQVCKGK